MSEFRRQVPREAIPQIEKSLRKAFDENELPRMMEVFEARTPGELEEKLQQEGTSLASMRTRFNEKTIAAQWIQERMSEVGDVSHEELLDYYRDHLNDYEYESQVRWEELMVRFDRFDGDRHKAYQLIAEMGNQVYFDAAAQPDLRGAAFSEVAKAKSDGFTADKGGVHDWTTKGALVAKSVDEALFRLEVGRMSRILTGPTGFHIIRVLERKPAGRTPFTEAQADIRRTLTKERVSKSAEDYVVRLRKNARIWTAFTGDISVDEISSIRQ